MKNRGFTLIELLGVIIILSFLMIIAFPKISNSARNSSDKTDRLTKDIIYKAASLYISDNKNMFYEKNGNSYCIPLQDLVSGDYLKSPIKLSDSEIDITNIKSVQVKYNDGFTYELKDNSNCVENIQ